KLTPRAVESEYRRILAARDIRENLATMRSAGAQVEYRAIDIRDAAAVGAAIDDARRKYGPVCGLIHGSGVLADKRIEEKTIEQFASVYSTKVDGLRSLLSATSTDPLAFIALFSSSTARFGRIGQADYAAANEVLNASARELSRTTSDCRVVA